MKKLIKQIVFLVLAAVPRNRGKASILMYHSVGKNAAEFTVSPAMFERQLNYLVANQYIILSVSAFVERLRAANSVSSCISLTFDDGYRDMYEVVFPIIKAHNVPISIFLSTGHIGSLFSTSRGDTFPMLTWEQISEMHTSGLVEFLPHGRMHYSLPSLSTTEAREEILGSLTDLTDKLGPTKRIYAYAKGKYSSEDLDILAEESFLAAVTVRPGYISSQSSMLELPRQHVGASTSFAEFRSRVRGSATWYGWFKRAVTNQAV